MKKIKLKCNTCGSINSVDENVSTFVCFECQKTNNVNECFDINKEKQTKEYYKHSLLLALSSNNKEKIKENAEKIKEIDPYDIFGLIYTANEKEKIEHIKKIKIVNKDLDYVLRYSVVLNNELSHEDKLFIINDIEECTFKNIYLQMLDYNNVRTNIEGIKVEDFYDQTFEVNETIHPLIYRIISLIAFVAIVLIALICNIASNKVIAYSIINILAFIPIILLGFSLNKLINIKNVICQIMFCLIFYLIISYIITINLHTGSFFETIINHFKELWKSIGNIASYITENSHLMKYL